MHIAEHLAATVLTFEWILHVQIKEICFIKGTKSY